MKKRSFSQLNLRLEPQIVIRLKRQLPTTSTSHSSPEETAIKVDSDSCAVDLESRFSLQEIHIHYPGIYVYPSTIPQAGLGVFAHTDLPKGTRIPYVGVLESTYALKNAMYAMWAGSNLVWNALPALDPFKQCSDEESSSSRFSSFGPFVAGRINQTSKGHGMRANVRIRQGRPIRITEVPFKAPGCVADPFEMCYEVTRPIKAGSELLTRYNRNEKAIHEKV